MTYAQKQQIAKPKALMVDARQRSIEQKQFDQENEDVFSLVRQHRQDVAAQVQVHTAPAVRIREEVAPVVFTPHKAFDASAAGAATVGTALAVVIGVVGMGVLI